MIWNERGLTLAEILVAVAILGIGLVGLAVVVPIASYGVQEGSQLSTASFLAEQRLEQIRNAPWVCQARDPATGACTSVNDCIGSGGTAPAVSAGAACANGAIALAAGATTFADEANVVWGNNTSAAAVTGGYSRTVRIADCSPTPCALLTSATMRQVTVTVTYRPLTSGGVSPTNKTVSVQWMVARK